MSAFKYFGIFYIPRQENALANMLSWLATLVNNSFNRIYIEYLEAPSTNKIEEVQQVNQEPSWINPFIKFLAEGVLLNNPLKVK